MNTKDLEGTWEAHARYDPLWAILSDPTKKDRGWEIDRFFASGDREIRFVLRDLESAGIDVTRAHALDFGCGVGRLTHALSRHFDRVVGVDIAPTMVALAHELNVNGPNRDSIRFVHNPHDDLAVLGTNTFDFVYSNIVLQHIPPELAKRYLGEFRRILRPGGVVVFQLPSHPRPSDERTVRAMPDGAYRAELRVDEWPRVVAPASRIGLAVQVTNVSLHAWHPDALGQVNLGNHWLARDGSMQHQDDARAGLPAPVKPGEHVEILIAVTTPDRVGDYLCELDLVHETITWFQDRGSEACQLPMEITRQATSHAGALEPEQAPGPEATWSDAWETAQTRLLAAKSESEPTLPRQPEPFCMFGMPRQEVLDLLASIDMAVLAVDEDGHAGWDWVGYRYSARKRS